MLNRKATALSLFIGITDVQFIFYKWQAYKMPQGHRRCVPCLLAWATGSCREFATRGCAAEAALGIHRNRYQQKPLQSCSSENVQDCRDLGWGKPCLCPAARSIYPCPDGNCRQGHNTFVRGTSCSCLEKLRQACPGQKHKRAKLSLPPASSVAMAGHSCCLEEVRQFCPTCTMAWALWFLVGEITKGIHLEWCFWVALMAALPPHLYEPKQNLANEGERLRLTPKQIFWLQVQIPEQPHLFTSQLRLVSKFRATAMLEKLREYVDVSYQILPTAPQINYCLLFQYIVPVLTYLLGQSDLAEINLYIERFPKYIAMGKTHQLVRCKMQAAKEMVYILFCFFILFQHSSLFLSSSVNTVLILGSRFKETITILIEQN